MYIFYLLIINQHINFCSGELRSGVDRNSIWVTIYICCSPWILWNCLHLVSFNAGAHNPLWLWNGSCCSPRPRRVRMVNVRYPNSSDSVNYSYVCSNTSRVTDSDCKKFNTMEMVISFKKRMMDLGSFSTCNI